jgi:hypothetical protein
MKNMEDTLAARRDEHRKRFEQMGKTNPAFAHLPSLPEPPKLADNNFVRDTRQLIEILVGAGRTSDAQKIRDEALKEFKDDRLESAITDAEKKVRSAHEIPAAVPR